MNLGAVLVLIALVLAVVSLFPTVDSRLLAVSVILVCVGLLFSGVTVLDIGGR